MTKMAVMSIYGKKFLLQNQLADSHETFYVAPGMTFTYFTARSVLETYTFTWKKMKTMDFFGNFCSLKPETWLMQTTYKVN